MTASITPTFGDVVRTHLKLQKKDVGDVLEAFRTKLGPRQCEQVFTEGFGSTLPLQVSNALVEIVGQKTYYWRKINRACKANRLQAVSYIVDPSEPENGEVDTVISSNTILGTALVFGGFPPEIYVQGKRCHAQFHSIDRYTMRLIWLMLRRWSEMGTSETTLTVDADYLIQCQSNYITQSDLRIAEFKLASSGFKAEVPLFSSVAYNRNTLKYQVEWNSRFVDCATMEVTGLADATDMQKEIWNHYL